MGLDLVADSKGSVSMRQGDLALAHKKAKAVGQPTAQLLAAASRRLLLALAGEGRVSNAELRALKEYHQKAPGSRKLPRPRIAISKAERDLIEAVCKRHEVSQVNFYGYAVHSYE